MDAVKIFDEIVSEAKTHTSDDRFVRVIQIGQAVRQGDVYLHCVNNDHGHHDKFTGDVSGAGIQLAPGATKGSQHTVSGVKVYDSHGFGQLDNVLVGPVIVANTRFTLAHPEHANISLPSGTYQVTYQRDFEQEEIARVAD